MKKMTVFAKRCISTPLKKEKLKMFIPKTIVCFKTNYFSNHQLRKIQTNVYVF